MTRLLALLVCALPAWAGPDDSVVKVNRHQFLGDRKTEAKTAGGWGTGTVVASSKAGFTVLTNRHVAPDANAFYFVQHDRYTFAAKWVRADAKTDLALLEVVSDLPGLPPAAPLAAAEPPAGAPVRSWGCTHAGPMNLHTGTVDDDADDHRDWDKYQYLRTTFVGNHGDSGAGVFDKAGQLVGVNYGGPDWDAGYRGHPYAMCVRLADVRRFLGGKAGPAAEKPRDRPAGPLREQPK